MTAVSQSLRASPFSVSQCEKVLKRWDIKWDGTIEEAQGIPWGPLPPYQLSALFCMVRAVVDSGFSCSPCNLVEHFLFRGYWLNKPKVINGGSLQISLGKCFLSPFSHWGPPGRDWKTGSKLKTTPIREGNIILGSSCKGHHRAAIFGMYISPWVLPSVNASLHVYLPAFIPCFSKLSETNCLLGEGPAKRTETRLACSSRKRREARHKSPKACSMKCWLNEGK